ncbi:MAG: hypothetical protein GY746_16200 [Gammaproteobacteria bacterium]|nr:hypothetical protein [Gammaproteobacteria bacterium]
MDIQNTLQDILDHHTGLEFSNEELQTEVESLRFKNHMLVTQIQEHQQEDKVAAKLSETRKELKELKSLNPKKLKEQVKRIKAKNDDLNKRAKTLEADVKKYRDEVSARRKSQEQIGLHEIARGDFGYITMLPWRESLTIHGVGEMKGSMVLIWMDGEGIGRAIVPGKDGEPIACKPRKYELPTVPKEVLKIAGGHFAKYKRELTR